MCKRKQSLYKLLKKTKNLKNLIILGDWNNTIEKTQSNNTQKIINGKLKATVKKFQDRLQLPDIHNTLSDGKINYTCTAGKSRTRIDRIYVSENLKQRILQYKIVPNYYSDHGGIEMLITWGRQITWGKGIWKMNTILLDDQEFNNRITDLIEGNKINKQGEKPTDPILEWENLKYKIKTIAISRSAKIRKENNSRKQMLPKRIVELQQKIDSGSKEQVRNEKDIRNYKKQLEHIEESKYEGARIRSRVEEMKECEKPNKKFYKYKEKLRGEQKQIECLTDDKGKERQKPSKIMRTIEIFYTNLYRSEGINRARKTKHTQHRQKN